MLTNYVYKLRPNTIQSSKMGSWVDMLKSHYNWCLNDRLTQYAQQFIMGEYCDIRTKSEACPLTCFVSKNGATGEPWKDSKLDKKGNFVNPRRTAGMIQDAALPELKRARPWYGGIDSTALQQNIKRLDRAYQNFFDGRGFPKFKNRSNFTSFTMTMGIKVQKNKIYLPKLGWIRFYNSRLIPSGFVIKAATVRQRQDGWYVSVRLEDKSVPDTGRMRDGTCEMRAKLDTFHKCQKPDTFCQCQDYIARPLTDVQSIIGCDLGLTKLVHLSDNHQIDNPKFATNKKTKRALKIRQRRINHKNKGSANRKKEAKKVGRLHKKITDKRQAYQWYVANKIVSRNVDAIAIENLNISGMMRRCKVKIDSSTGRFLNNGQSRKKALNRSIADASWSDLTLKIEYLAAKQGKVVIKVNPKHSSQECRKCGHVDKSNRDGEKFICTQCGFMTHADIGAAKTIRDRALNMVRGDSAKPKRPKNCKEISIRSLSKRVEPGNL